LLNVYLKRERIIMHNYPGRHVVGRGRHAAMRLANALPKWARVPVGAAMVLALGGGAVALAVPSGASETLACAFNSSGTCGAQALGNLSLAMAATNKPGVGTRVQVLNWATTNGKEDFYAFNPPGTSGTPQNWKVFQYAPKGAPYTSAAAPDGLCATVTGGVGSTLALEDCNYAYAQQFSATEQPNGTFTWRERGQSQVITDPHNGGQYTTLVIANPTQDYAAGQDFTAHGYVG
jgi:hypothetical protein